MLAQAICAPSFPYNRSFGEKAEVRVGRAIVVSTIALLVHAVDVRVGKAKIDGTVLCLHGLKALFPEVELAFDAIGCPICSAQPVGDRSILVRRTRRMSFNNRCQHLDTILIALVFHGSNPGFHPVGKAFNARVSTRSRKAVTDPNEADHSQNHKGKDPWKGVE